MKKIQRHGMQIRNYREELNGLVEEAEKAKKVVRAELMLTIADMLSVHPGLETSVLTPRTNLPPLAQWVYKEAVPAKLFGVNEAQWQGGAERYIKNTDNYNKAAGRASQMLWQLRHIFAHETPKRKEDAIALLDCLSFLAARLNLPPQPAHDAEASCKQRMYIAVDGDDVGRRFEERLAECVSASDVTALCRWSQKVQQELSAYMIELVDRRNASFLARTEDGFLASFPESRFDSLIEKYRPQLLDAETTVTTGIGRTVKDAYLALKLGKARNRGGGILFSFDPPEERILWERPEPATKQH